MHAMQKEGEGRGASEWYVCVCVRACGATVFVQACPSIAQDSACVCVCVYVCVCGQAFVGTAAERAGPQGWR
jgi:hypothetical protein